MTEIIANRYQIEAELGTGGMGTVYRAINIQTKQTVAIKRLHADIIKNDPEVLERFRREGQALRDLNHPNIVKMLDDVQENGTNYLVLEYISGGDLKNIIDKETLTTKRILNISIDLADALTRAHRLDIIHRDLKPANILLAQDGTIRLTDFGVAHIASERRVTATSSIIGTVDYLPPEALQGQVIDARADIWAFGVILFEMLAGQRPFLGTELGPIVASILYGELPALEELRSDVPLALVDLVYRMLEKDPQARIASVRHVGAALEDILQGRDSSPNITSALHFATPTPQPIALQKQYLPTQTTPFVGREAELTEVQRLLDDPDIRLMTLLAPGGMGKTRLAIESARRNSEKFKNGVYFIDLAPLSDAANIIPTIAEATGYQFQQDGREQKQQILDYLSSKNLLLIMDNYEHLMDGVRIVTEILNAAPDVQILVTSRIRLAQTGEAILHLSGIEFPRWETPEDALEYAAVKLFMQSAKRAQPGFELTLDKLDSIAHICRIVQGMPLGIVLAASWLAMLTPHEIAAELEQGIDILEVEAGEVPDRQHSIRVVFSYSWDSMSQPEQEVFMKLSSFRGGFTREAAEAVAGANLRYLMGFVNKSLLRRDVDTGRYTIHELLRQFAEEQLKNAALEAEIQEIYATYFADLMQQQGEHMQDHRFAIALDTIKEDIENIRTSWRYWVRQANPQQLNKYILALWIAYEIQSWFQPAVSLFEEGIKALADGSSRFPQEEIEATQAHLSAAQAWFLGLLGQPHDGLNQAKKSITILKRLNRQHELYIPLTGVNINAIFLNQIADVEEAGQELLAVSETNQSIWERGWALAWLPYAAIGRQEPEKAIKLGMEGLEIFEKLHNPFGISVMTGIILGGGAMAQGNFMAAKEFFQRGLQAAQSIGYLRLLQIAYDSLGTISLIEKQTKEAQQYILKSLLITQQSGQVREMLGSLRDFALLRQMLGQNAEAIELLAIILHHPASIQNSLFRQERLQDEAEALCRDLEERLAPDIYQAAWEHGKSLDLETVVQKLIEELEGTL